MYIDVVPNRGSPPAILLRESVREGRRIRKRTLANLSSWPPDKVEMLRRLLRGETLVPPQDAFEIVRTRPHGHVAAVLGTVHRLGLEHLIASKPSRQRPLVVAMIAARLLKPRSKLATARGLGQDTLSSSLGEVLGVEGADEDALYEAMDWLLARQERIEAALARRHLGEGTLVLYDVTSSYLEGRHCPLAAFGYNRDQKRGKKQIVWGLLTNSDGCPVAIEVFGGKTRDSATLPVQIEKLKTRFGIGEVVLVGDRGMITKLHRQALDEHGYAWITALKAPEVRELRQRGLLQLSLFDQHGLAEIIDLENSARRLVMCRNWKVGNERRRKREDLLQATEAELAKIQTSVAKGRLKDETKIALKVGKVIDKFKVGKHFVLTIGPGRLEFRRDEEAIAVEAALDGIYVVQTNVGAGRLTAQEVVGGYKSLRHVERAFRSMKTMQLELRPIFHRLAARVRAHALLCMLAYYVQWHMERALTPLRDEQPDLYGSFRHVLSRLGEIQLNTVQIQQATFDLVTEPDAEQRLFLDHLAVRSLLP